MVLFGQCFKHDHLERINTWLTDKSYSKVGKGGLSASKRNGIYWIYSALFCTILYCFSNILYPPCQRGPCRDTRIGARSNSGESHALPFPSLLSTTKSPQYPVGRATIKPSQYRVPQKGFFQIAKMSDQNFRHLPWLRQALLIFATREKPFWGTL